MSEFDWAIPFTEQQWDTLISEALHICILEDCSPRIAAESALMGVWHRSAMQRSAINIFQLANEINQRLD